MNNATTAAPQLPPGTVIDGTYTTGAVVRSRLGSVTYAATDLSGARVDVTVYAPASQTGRLSAALEDRGVIGEIFSL